MSGPYAHLDELTQLLRTALDHHRDLQKQLRHEKEKHQQALVEKQNLETEVHQLKEQVKTIKLAQAINGRDDQSTRELKNQINRYLREIDKCLHLINRD
ncbi:MAG: hypothetical protein JNL88_05935 [Bacteroidia bacterium]|nr:hypothetical protein [Bacteroidia bacterium]